MPRKNIIISPSTVNTIERIGARINRARLRRNINVKFILEQTGISETTFYAIEKGSSTVSIVVYAIVLAVLGLDKDFELIALDDEGKK